MGITDDLLSIPVVQDELDQMPIFQKYLSKYKRSKVFSDHSIGIVHVFAPNTIIMIATLLAGGAEIELITNSGLTHDQQTLEIIDNFGIQIHEDHPEYRFDFTLDCGGYFTNYHPRIGTVEVTRSGIHSFNALSHPPYKMVDVDTTKSKMIETFLGNPEGVFRTIDHFFGDPASFIEEKQVAVIGFGKIGRGIARKLHSIADVSIVDKSERALRKARELGFKAFQLTSDKEVNSKLIEDTDIIFTSTGHPNVMTDYFVKEYLESHLKFNLGAVDEWGSDYTETDIFQSKTKPLNFNLSPPTPSKYIDPILALQVDGLKYLIKNYDTLPVGHNPIPAKLDQRIFDLFNQFHNNQANLINIYFDDY